MVKTLPLKEALASLKLPGLERNLFFSPQWMTVIDRTYGPQIFVKYVERDGRIASYVFYTVVQNFLEWKICVCSYCDYSDAYVEKAEDWQAFFESFRQQYPQFRIAIRSLRDSLVRANPNFQVLSQECFHILDLRADIDTIWRRTHDSFRSAVKQGQKNNVLVKVCDKKHLPDFYRMHLNLRKSKYKVFPQPYRFFDYIWQEYMDKGKGVMLGAFREDGRIIAANIYLECGNTMYYKFNTSELSAMNLRPNNLLFWEGIRLAKERGAEYLDLGSSGLEQKGLILFKDHAGAQQQRITHVGFAPPNYKFSKKRILKTITTICTLPWMPNGIIRLVSSIIYPYLA